MKLPLIRRISADDIANTLEDGFRWKRVAKSAPPETIYVNFVNIKKITLMNHEFRKKDQPTDVLSFSAEKTINEVYVCPEYIEGNALTFKVDFEEELLRVIIHGVLHILGYDHNKSFSYSKNNIGQKGLDKLEKMFTIQEDVLNYLYINR